MKPTKTKTVTVAYYANEKWHTVTYHTSNPRWREAYLILQQTYDRIRIIY